MIRGNSKKIAMSGGMMDSPPTALETFLERTRPYNNSSPKREAPGRKNTTTESELESTIADEPDFTINSPKSMKMSEKAFNKTFEQFQYMYHNVTKKPKQYDEVKIAASLQLIFDLQGKEELKRLEKKNSTTAASTSSGVGRNLPKK